MLTPHFFFKLNYEPWNWNFAFKTKKVEFNTFWASRWVTRWWCWRWCWRRWGWLLDGEVAGDGVGLVDGTWNSFVFWIFRGNRTIFHTKRYNQDSSTRNSILIEAITNSGACSQSSFFQLLSLFLLFLLWNDSPTNCGNKLPEWFHLAAGFLWWNWVNFGPRFEDDFSRPFNPRCYHHEAHHWFWAKLRLDVNFEPPTYVSTEFVRFVFWRFCLAICL